MGTYQSKRAKTSTEEHRTLEVLDNKPRIQGVGYGHSGTPRIVFPPKSTSVAKKEVQVSGGYYLLIGCENHLNVAEDQTEEKETFGSTN